MRAGACFSCVFGTISAFIISAGGIILMTRKILCALILAAALCVSCSAEEISGDVKRDSSGNVVDMKSPDGLRIIYLGTFRPEEKEIISPDEIADDSVFSVFMVKPDKDTPLQLDVRDGYDTRTNKFGWRNNAPWGYIADIDTNGNPRDILGSFWYRVTFWHNLPFKHGKFPVIARIGFLINGNELTYSRIRPKSYEEWKKIEPKILELEENEKECDFSLDERESVKEK